jgi:hypothetical protein
MIIGFGVWARLIEINLISLSIEINCVLSELSLPLFSVNVPRKKSRNWAFIAYENDS